MPMNTLQLKAAIENEIAGADVQTNLHGLDPRNGLVEPVRTTVIDRVVQNGKMRDRLEDVWLVFVEGSPARDGYRIVASLDGAKFGLASPGLPQDTHLVLCGWYGDFMTTFRGM